MMTAGIMGIVPRYRYILVTDSLLETLSLEELKAVLAHEMGHAKYRHLLFYILFFVGYMVLSFGLSDLFASLSIIVDKPFVIGDFIVIGDLRGTVERIGLKTTRIRSLSGEQIVFSNSDLLSSRVRNYKRMYERRISFSIGVTYDTNPELLERIPKMIEKIVSSQPKVRFDRCHFKSFGDFALIFETVYYMLVPDYNAYMDTQQAINLSIAREFAEEGIEFAYPTQTIYLAKGGPS